MKMMKFLKNKYKKTTMTMFVMSFLLVGTMFCSCDGYLTDDPKSQIKPENAFNSVEKLKNNALLTVYNYIGGCEESQGLQGTGYGVYDLNSFTTDEQIIPIRGSDWYDGGLWHRLFFHTWSANEAPFKNTWDYLYKVVILCNEGIEHIDAFKTDKIDEQEKLKSYKAELRAVRAMFYFYLMDIFGRVPLVTNTGVKSGDLTLSERQDLFYWIYQEFNEAMPDLVCEWSQFVKTDYYGRMTAYVAYFVMMKLALNAEIYTDNNWTDEIYPDGKAIQLKTYNVFSGEIMEGNAWETVRAIQNTIKAYYSLSDYYSDNFDVSNEGSKENIFVIPMDPLLYSNKYIYFTRSRHYCHGAALGGHAENGPCATVSTVKAFGYAEDNELDVDARFYFNFYFDKIIAMSKQVYEDDGVTPLVYRPLAVTDFDLSGDKYEKTAGARIAKYSLDATIRGDGRLGNNDIVLFRYADVLLMYAEASYRLGDLDNAVNALNSVYYRSNYKNKYTTIDEDILLGERLKELMWEGWRRNDLIRFRRFNKPYDLKTSAEHEEDGHTIVFPIPASLRAMHPDWEQNPGY